MHGVPLSWRLEAARLSQPSDERPGSCGDTLQDVCAGVRNGVTEAVLEVLPPAQTMC